jgi:hypothetical protein
MKIQASSVLITILIASVAFSGDARAVSPPPDGGYPGGNTAEGQSALLGLTTGGYNTAVGFFALRTDTTGQFNTALGAGTLFANTGDLNTGSGAAALLSNTDGIFNTANGAFTLFSNTTGGANTAVGAQALLNNTGGSDNNAFGWKALVSNTEGDSNNAVGVNALESNTEGSSNNAFGLNALVSNTTGDANTAVGHEALFSNTTGNQNNAVGYQALYSQQTGYANNAFGVYALHYLVDADGNNAFGTEALYSNVSGVGNTAIGDSAGRDVDGNYNICVGAGVEGYSGENNTIRIGDNLPTKPGFAACFIGGINGQTAASGTAVFIEANGKLGTITSSRRFKDHIEPMDSVSEVLYALRPVSFRYKKTIDPARTPQLGLVAEDVEKVNPDLIVRDNEGKPYSVRYDQVNAMLLNEFLKEHRTVLELKKEIAALTASVKEQAARIEKMVNDRSISHVAVNTP